MPTAKGNDTGIVRKAWLARRPHRAAVPSRDDTPTRTPARHRLLATLPTQGRAHGARERSETLDWLIESGAAKIVVGRPPVEDSASVSARPVRLRPLHGADTVEAIIDIGGSVPIAIGDGVGAGWVRCKIIGTFRLATF